MDEVLGAVAVSLRREKVPQTSMMGSANGNQSETFIQVSMICYAQYVLTMSFYLDFVTVLSRFYHRFIQIVS